MQKNTVRKPGDFRKGYTLCLSPIPAKPNPPLTKPWTSTKVNFIAHKPKNTCGIKSPILAWNVTSREDKEEVHRCSVKTNISYQKICVSNLNAITIYVQFQLHAKNEKGGEMFKIHIGSPSPLKDTHVPSKDYIHKLKFDRMNLILL